MNISTLQWTRVSPLPRRCLCLSAVVFQDTLYLAGGNGLSKSVFTCFLPDLLPPTAIESTAHQTFSSSGILWRETSNLPVTESTLASFGGDLLAIGGNDDLGKPTFDVYRYDFNTNSWTVVSHMKNKQSHCLAAACRDHIIVVGGYTTKLLFFNKETDCVEFIHE